MTTKLPAQTKTRRTISSPGVDFITHTTKIGHPNINFPPVM